MRYIRYGFWPKSGIFMIRVRGYFWSIKAPWNRPMFSEREGVDPTLLKFKGWRLAKRKVGE